MGTPSCSSRIALRYGDCAGGAERTDRRAKINAWATISLFGYPLGVQVSRWGLPMVTHLFLNDPGDQAGKKRERKNNSIRRFPSEDLEHFSKSIADFAWKMTTCAGSAADPSEYGQLIGARLCPDTLPYKLGTSAAFEVASFNGRALGDDALDVMLTPVTNKRVVDGFAPGHGRIRKDFPIIWSARIQRRVGRSDAYAAAG